MTKTGRLSCRLGPPALPSIPVTLQKFPASSAKPRFYLHQLLLDGAAHWRCIPLSWQPSQEAQKPCYPSQPLAPAFVIVAWQRGSCKTLILAVSLAGQIMASPFHPATSAVDPCGVSLAWCWKMIRLATGNFRRPWFFFARACSREQ